MSEASHDQQSPWGDLAIGGGLAVAMLVALRRLSTDLVNAAWDPTRSGVFRGSLVWVVLGIGTAVVVKAASSRPALVVVPLIALLVVFGPIAVNQETPQWYPDGLWNTAGVGFGPAPLVLIGVLAAPLVQRGWTRWRSGSSA